MPCHACGTTKGKQRKKRYCDECKALRDWRIQQRRKTRKIRERQPCIRCGGRKGDGHGRRLCDSCRAIVNAMPMCRRCGQQPVRRRAAQLCQGCADAAAERRRGRERLRAVRYRQRNLEQERERKRLFHERLRNDPARNARDLEQRRLRHRLRALREGRTLRQSRRNFTPEHGALPGWPLAMMIERLAESCDVETVCGVAGINERLLTAWRRYERSVSLEVADRVLTGLGLLWWDVWSEKTVRVPLFEVREYKSMLKKANGRHTRRRVLVRVMPYGDAGPDVAKLEEIQAMMTGDSVMAA